MTMSSSVSKVTLNGDGVQTSFPFSFKVWKAGDLEVSITSPAGANTVVTDWTVELAGSGGTVTYPTVGDPLPLGWMITIRRFMDFLQDVDLVSGTRFDPEVIETALDKAAAERQQLLEEISRAVRVGVASGEDPANVVNQVFEARDAAVSAALVAEASANLVGPLLGTEGSSLVGFVQDGTGAAARTVQDKLRDVVSVKDFESITSAIAYGISAGVRVLFPLSATIRIPTDAVTLQLAIDAIEAPENATITLQIQSGHQPIAGISVVNRNCSMFVISSQDAETVLAGTFPTDTDFLSVSGGFGPVLNCLINANGSCRHGVNVQNGARTVVNSGCGVKNVRQRGVYANYGSTVVCDGGIFTGAGSVISDGLSRGAWITRGSFMSAENADFSDSAGVGIYVSRASSVHAPNLTVLNAGNQAVWCHRSSRFTAHSSGGVGTRVSTNSAFPVVTVSRASLVNINADEAPGVIVTQTGSGSGIYATDGAVVNARSATIVGGPTSDTGIEVAGSATVNAQGVNISGFNINVQNTFGEIDAALSMIMDARSDGVKSNRGRTNLASASVQGSATGRDIICSNGSWVIAGGCSTTNGSGTPSLTDTNVLAFNAITGNRGVVFT